MGETSQNLVIHLNTAFTYITQVPKARRVQHRLIVNYPFPSPDSPPPKSICSPKEYFSKPFGLKQTGIRFDHLGLKQGMFYSLALNCRLCYLGDPNLFLY